MAYNTLRNFSGLILLSGSERGDAAQELFGTLSPFNITILDIEQIVIRGRLILTALIDLDPAHAEGIQIDLDELAKKLDMDLAIDFQDMTPPATDESVEREDQRILLLSQSFTPSSIHQVAEVLHQGGGRLLAIARIAISPTPVFEIRFSIANGVDLKEPLSNVAALERLDISYSQARFDKTKGRLVILDMDSTFIAQEVIDLLARKFGVEGEVSAITESAMNGEIDFATSLQARVAKLAGLDEIAIAEVAKEIALTSGARELVEQLHSRGDKVGIVSGGFLNVIEPLLNELKIDFYRANTLEIKDGKLTGKTLGPIIDRAAKAAALREFAQISQIELSQCVAIGDGANDLEMMAVAGLSIAFNAKPAVRVKADCAINSPTLDSVPYLMGI